MDKASELRKKYEAQGGTNTIFTGKVADYITSRPDYPKALLEALPHAEDIADIGAGTGLLTKALLAEGKTVTAVEPNEEMRQACDTQLNHYNTYKSTAGTAEQTKLKDNSQDLITAAQAFHWFDIEPARREALRILRPHGQVALVWNDRVATDPLHIALNALFAEFGGERRGAMVRNDADRSGVPVFFQGAYENRQFAHEHQLTKGGLQALAFSRSYMPPRDSDAGRRAMDTIGAVFDRFASDGVVAVRYNTVLMCGRPSAEGAHP